MQWWCIDSQASLHPLGTRTDNQEARAYAKLADIECIYVFNDAEADFITKEFERDNISPPRWLALVNRANRKHVKERTE